MNEIYKTPHGKHIDLSKLVAISDAYFIDRMGAGGFFAGYSMEFQLLDRQVVFEREFALDSWNSGGISFLMLMTDGKFHDHTVDTDDSKIKDVYDLQKEVDQIIKAWKSFKAVTP